MGHLVSRSRSLSVGVFRPRLRTKPVLGPGSISATIGGWGGIFWENLCTEFDHTRTAQEITDSALWCTDWRTTVAGVFLLEGPGYAYTPADVASRQPLWDDADDFAAAVLVENWSLADTERLNILAWTP